MITLDEFCETRTFRGTKLFVLSFTNLFWINRSKKPTLFRSFLPKNRSYRDTRPNDRTKNRSTINKYDANLRKENDANKETVL